MNFKNMFLGAFFLSFLFMLSMVSPGYLIEGIFISLIYAAILGFLIAGYIFVFYDLIDDVSIFCKLIAVLMTGVIGTVILIGVRMIYRETGSTFFS